MIRRGGARRETANDSHGTKRKPASSAFDFRYVVRDGEPTHILVPIEEYERLQLADMVQEAIHQIESAKEEDYVDADRFRLELAAERIAKARKAAGLTQTQLGKKLGIPQSQISRIERNPDHTTVRTLKRIAKALKVDVRALI